MFYSTENCIVLRRRDQKCLGYDVTPNSFLTAFGNKFLHFFPMKCWQNVYVCVCDVCGTESTRAEKKMKKKMNGISLTAMTPSGIKIHFTLCRKIIRFHKKSICGAQVVTYIYDFFIIIIIMAMTRLLIIIMLRAARLHRSAYERQKNEGKERDGEKEMRCDANRNGNIKRVKACLPFEFNNLIKIICI